MNMNLQHLSPVTNHTAGKRESINGEQDPIPFHRNIQHLFPNINHTFKQITEKDLLASLRMNVTKLMQRLKET